jgi:hypothetical protein
MHRLPFIEPERCGRCGRITILFDYRSQTCFECFHDLSPFSKKQVKVQAAAVQLPESKHVLDVKV